MKIIRTEIHSTQHVCRVLISRNMILPNILGVFQARFSLGRNKYKQCWLFAHFPGWSIRSGLGSCAVVFTSCSDVAFLNTLSWTLHKIKSAPVSALCSTACGAYLQIEMSCSLAHTADRNYVQGDLGVLVRTWKPCLGTRGLWTWSWFV